MTSFVIGKAYLRTSITKAGSFIEILILLPFATTLAGAAQNATSILEKQCPLSPR